MTAVKANIHLSRHGLCVQLAQLKDLETSIADCKEMFRCEMAMLKAQVHQLPPMTMM